MRKVAIVGVEGSGKTVMLAGLGDLYTYPDEDGYFLAPKNFGTAEYVAEKIERMRKGEWPVATAGDEMQGLDWTLSRQKEGGRVRPAHICEVSFLDFAGEVYRAAYGISNGEDASLKEQVEELKQYVCGADDLIVLINLRDVITNGLGDKRVQEAMWITKSILDTALGDEAGTDAPRAAIVLSQADSYAETIKACGGALGVLKKYLPYVANSYGWLDVFSASAVDKTVLNADGNMVPAADFTTQGLLPIMAWICGGKETENRMCRIDKVLGDKGTAGADSSFTSKGCRSFMDRRKDGAVSQPAGEIRPSQEQHEKTFFKGRIGRRDFWRATCGYWALLLVANLLYVVPIVSTLHGRPLTRYPGGAVSVCAGVFLIVCCLTRLTPITARRLHDFNVGAQGLFMIWLFGFVPFLGFIVELVFFLVTGSVKGTVGENVYGVSPEKSKLVHR